MRNSQTYELWDTITPVAVTSSTDATPIVITATAHGLVTGDFVMIFGHATNTAANGIFKVTKVDDDSFQLKHRYTGASVAGSGGGAGTGGVLIKAPKILLVNSFKLIQLHLITSSSANLTLKFAISNGLMNADEGVGHGDTPNFGATNNKDNPYTHAQAIDLQNGAAVNGDTGVVLAGTDINKTYEINLNGTKYFCPIVTAWSAGAITLKALLVNDD